MLAVETYPTLAEASGAMNERARFLAGGTLLMRAVNFGDQSFDRVIRAREVETSIRPDAAGVRIGAGVTMAQLLANREVSFLHPVVRVIGGPAIRNMATVGGNLFARNPFGDLAVALLALDAQVVTIGGGSEPMESFLAGRDHARRLVAAVVVARPSEGEFRFAKVSRVKPKGVSLIAIAAWLRRGDPRLAFGNMGPHPLRAKAAERALVHAALDASGIAPTLADCTQDLRPEDDSLATAWYRREVAPVYLGRLLLNKGPI